jgi:glycosyltransferase 2 family protein
VRRSAAKWFGLAFSAACLAYFVVETRKVWSNEAIAWSGSQVLHALPLAMLPYFAAYSIMALAWHLLLRAMGIDVAARRSVGIYFTTQIAKYLPGNVGQHVGRVYLASANGMPAMRVGMSMIVEIALVVGAAVVLALPLAPQILARLQDSRFPWLPVALAIAACGAIAVYALRRHRHVASLMEHARASWRHANTAGGRRFLLGASALELLGMTLAGASLAVLAVSSEATITTSAIATSIAVFSAAWIVGFLAPGAPAGLGIREAILLAGLSPTFGAGTAVQIAILFRVLSVSADLVALCVGGLLLRARRETA